MMLRILLRNIVSNWCGFAVQAIAAFFLTPFVLHSLGETRYGIWALVLGFTGYYGLLDLGFRAGITQYLTRHLATADFEQMNRVASTSVAALAACGVPILMIAAGLSWLAPMIFAIPPHNVAEMRWCILIIGTSSAISFVFFTFSAVFAATQRYDMANAISIGMRLVSAVATVAALRQGYGLIGLSVINAASDLLGYVLRMRVAYRVLPQLRISPRMAAWETLWPITTYGIWSFLNQSALLLRSYMSIFIIGLLMPIAAITSFNLANQVIVYFNTIFSPMAIVFFPAATHLDALGDSSGLKQMYLVGSRMMLLLSVALGAIATIWADDFFRLWVGQRMAEGGEYPPIAGLFQILMVTAIIVSGQRIGIQVFMAIRQLKVMTSLRFAEAVVSLILSFCLIHYYGLAGATLAMLLPAIVFQAVVQPAVLCRYLKLSPIIYFLRVYGRPAVVGIVLFPMLKVYHDSSPVAHAWRDLFFHGAVAAFVAISVLAIFGLESIERRRFLLDPLRRVVSRFSQGAVQNNP